MHAPFFTLSNTIRISILSRRAVSFIDPDTLPNTFCHIFAHPKCIKHRLAACGSIAIRVSIFDVFSHTFADTHGVPVFFTYSFTQRKSLYYAKRLAHTIYEPRDDALI